MSAVATTSRAAAAAKQQEQQQAAKGKPAQDVYAAEMAGIPALAALGALWKSTAVEAKDRETEYAVTVVKHVFGKGLFFFAVETF